MNVTLIVAGSLGILAAAVHGVGGELLVVRRLSREMLPATRFGGARMTMAMIHVSWHIASVALLTLGAGLVLAGSALDGDVSQAVGLSAAAAFTGFAAVGIGLGVAYTGSLRTLYRHLGPVVFAVTAALAWVGAL